MCNIEKMAARRIQIADIERPLKKVKALLKAFGWNVFDPQWNPLDRWFAVLIAFGINFYALLGCCATIYDNWGTDKEKVLESATFIVLTLNNTIRVGILFAFRKSFRNIYKILRDEVWPLMEQLDENQKLFSRLITYTRLQTIYCVCGGASFFLCELEMVIKRLAGSHEPMLDMISTFMPSTSPFLEFGWIIQSVYAYYGLLTYVIFDSLLLYLIVMAVVQCDLLILLSKQRCDGGVKVNQILRDFYKYHLIFLSYMQDAVGIISMTLICWYLYTTLFICAFLISWNVSWTSMAFGRVSYLLVNLLVICIYGEWIKTMQNNVRDALIDVDWTNWSSDQKKKLLIILMMATNEVQIKPTACPELALQTLTLIAQKTYQVFVVLREL